MIKVSSFRSLRFLTKFSHPTLRVLLHFTHNSSWLSKLQLEEWTNITTCHILYLLCLTVSATLSVDGLFPSLPSLAITSEDYSCHFVLQSFPGTKNNMRDNQSKFKPVGLLYVWKMYTYINRHIHSTIFFSIYHVSGTILDTQRCLLAILAVFSKIL